MCLLFLKVIASMLKRLVHILELGVPTSDPTRRGSYCDNGRLGRAGSHLVAMGVVRVVVDSGGRL